MCLFFNLIMCGILAIFGHCPTANPNVLKRRGPDFSGSFSEDGVFLYHTRLAIVHPESGAQPIYYKDWVITMNGEIYNASFSKTETDCSWLPKILDEHGPEGIRLLDGIFSFVAYNTKTTQVIVGRDPIGVTPLYMTVLPNTTVIFSSLLDALPRDCIPEQVLPGRVASFKAGELPSFTKWTPDYKIGDIISPSSESCLELMQTAIKKRLMGDVPWGVLLSGGLDSTIVASLATRIADKVRPDYPRVHSFCIGLENSPDIFWASKVARELGTFHTSITYTIEEGLQAIPEVIRAVETYDVTTVRASTPMWLMGRVLKTRGIKMVLSGEGSDELFAGYLYNLYCPDENAMAEECKRKMDELYAYDCQRANKSLGDWGVETRVPFLDSGIVNFAMNILSPRTKLSGTHPDGPKPEKWWLRQHFGDYIPSCVKERTKAQFSDAVGSAWIDALKETAEQMVSDEMMASASVMFPYNTPSTKEAYWYRKIFAEKWPKSQQTVLYQATSIACSTGVASQWHSNFAKEYDPSGDAIHRAFKEL